MMIGHINMIKIKSLIKEQNDYIIYYDMDSVLSDFDAAFRKISDVPVKDGWEYKKKFSKQKFWNLIAQKGLEFWSTMPWMADGKKLWSYLTRSPYEVIILSAPSTNDKAISERGKKIWCKNNLGSNVKIILDGDKYKYAGHNKVLIDDLEKNIIPWRQHGGIGILHKNAIETLQQLQKLGIF